MSYTVNVLQVTNQEDRKNAQCVLHLQTDSGPVEGERKHLYHQSREARNPGENLGDLL